MIKRFLEVEEIQDLVEQRVFLFSDEQEEQEEETTEEEEDRKGGKADV